MFSSGDDAAAKNKFGMTVSVFAGFLVGAGWWIYIDGATTGIGASDGLTESVVGYSWIFPIIMGLAHLMINGMNFTELMTDEDRPGVATRARLFLMLAVVMQIAMVFASAMIMGQVYLTDNKDTANRWSGISLLLSQIIMFVACWTQRLPTLPTPST